MRRILDLSGATSDSVFRLRVDKGCLLIAHGADESPEEVRVPAQEVSVLVLGHRLALTGAVLGHVTANGGTVLVLDDRYRPSGLMLPVEGNKAHAQRLHWQIDRTSAVAPRLWQQIVRAKVRAQSLLVPEAGLDRLLERVEPGDPGNVEAAAARVYWPKLFGKGFRRHQDDDVNVALNYGYTVLRALVARTVCASGLHPALGLHHHGWRDTFALADDLMEPARPLIDAVVSKLGTGALDASKKRAILGIALAEVETPAGERKLIEAYEGVAQSLVRVLETGTGELELPEANR